MDKSKADEKTDRPLNFPNTNFDIIALAASAGGLKAILAIVSHLPLNFPAAVIVLQHFDRKSHSLLPEILSRRTSLEVKEAEEGDYLRPGFIYTAPSNYHLIVNLDGSLSLTQSEVVNFVRPSADILFNSIANTYKNRAIAVVLSGTGQDGSKGVETIKKQGGIVIVQNCQTSEFEGMPKRAIATGKVDFITPLSEIATMLMTLVMQNQEIIL